MKSSEQQALVALQAYAYCMSHSVINIASTLAVHVFCTVYKECSHLTVESGKDVRTMELCCSVGVCPLTRVSSTR